MGYEYEIANLLNKIRAKEDEIARLNVFIRQMRGISNQGSSMLLNQLEIRSSEWCDITTNRACSLPVHLSDVKSGIVLKVDRMCQKAEEKKCRIRGQINQMETDVKMYRAKALKGDS